MDKKHVGGSTPQPFQLPTSILNDLCSRFIINIPMEERNDMIRVFFQIELAHWFYLDFYCPEIAELKTIGIRDFASQVFKHVPTLSPHADQTGDILSSWKEYKMTVPTYGAILLDESCEHCLLVQGYWSKSNWGFPKGKVNEEEEPHACAIREVLEETGFDISELIDKEEYLEYNLNEQHSRLYIIHGVSMETMFQPRTRKEIRALEWFRVEYLPSTKKDTVSKEMYNLNPNSFFMIIPYVRPLRRWIAKKLGRSHHEQPNRKHGGRGSKSHNNGSGRWELGPEGPVYTQAEDGAVKPVMTDKQRASQQQQFSQIMKQECRILQQLKEQNDKSQRQEKRSKQPRSNPATTGTDDEKMKHNSIQILNRDGTLSGGKPSRRSLENCFNASAADSSPSPRQVDIMPSSTWANFAFDTESILSSMKLAVT